MKKKLQVFISSTFTDLIEERQAAVQAVLKAGHIPAGMELFKSADESQKETIKRWIDESDVYILILGGRYGSIDEETGKSYTHWEYDYAGEVGKERFAIVITEEASRQKGQANLDFIERKNFAKYEEFRKFVLSKISTFFSDERDIKLAISDKLPEFNGRNDLHGWVSGKDIPDVKGIMDENARLLKDNGSFEKENVKLKAENNKLKEISKGTDLINGFPYEVVKQALSSKVLKLPKKLDEDEREVSVLQIFQVSRGKFATSIENSMKSSDMNIFLFYNVSPFLLQYGLLEKSKVAGVKYEKIQTSKEGFKFLIKYDTENSMKELTIKE